MPAFSDLLTAPLADQIYTVTGRLVRSLVEEQRVDGVARVTWDGRDSSGRPVASGAYFVAVVLGGHRQTERLILLR